MKKLLFVLKLVFLFFHSNIYSQFYNSEYHQLEITGISSDKDQNLFYFFKNSSVLAKATPDNQNILWAKTFDSTYQWGIKDSWFEGNNSMSVSFLQSTPYLYSILRKTDPNGNILWSKKISANTNVYSMKGLTTRDKNIYLGSGNCAFDNYIIKLDSLGNFLWGKTYDQSGIRGTVISLIEDYDGNIIVTSTMAIISSLTQLTAFYKIDPDGNIIWNKFYQNPQAVNSSMFHKVIITPKKEIFHKMYGDNNADGTYRSTILKVDSLGNFLWCNKYSSNSVLETVMPDFTADVNGDLICTVYGYDNQNHLHGGIMKINGTSGNPYHTLSTDTCFLETVTAIYPNKFIFGGSKIYDYAGKILMSDSLLSNLCTFTPTSATATPQAIIQQPYSFSTSNINLTITPVIEIFNSVSISQSSACSTILTNVNNEVKISLSSFPNPCNGILKIKSDQNIIIESLKLFDLLGEQVQLNFLNSSNEDLIIEIIHKHQGLYFLEGKTVNGNYFQKKIIMN